MPGTEMPAFAQSQGGMLTDAQVNALIAGMRRQWSRPNAFAGAAPPPTRKRGAAIRIAESLPTRRIARRATQPSHQQITSPVYLALVSDQALRDIIVAGRPDIGQPDWRNDAPAGKTATPLTSAEVDDIISYLASLRHAEHCNCPQTPRPADPQQTRGETK